MSRFGTARRARCVALALLGAGWAVACIAGLETWARWEAYRADLLARDLEQRVYAVPEWRDRDQDVARKVLGAWPDTDADLRAWRELLKQPPGSASWQQRADTFNEAFLFLDADGRVVDRVTPASAGSPLEGLLSRFKPGVVVADALPPDCAGDAETALRAASMGLQIRDYPVPLHEGTTPEVFQFVWLVAEPGAAPSVLCVVRESIWKELWLTFRPDVHHRDIMDFQSNSLGWRDDEVALPKPAGTVRIVCVGGSTTAEGPHNALTYPNLLERYLKDRWPGINVVNAGIFALLSFGEAGHAEDYLALEPDLLLHYNFVNDVISVLDHAVAAEPFLSYRKLLRWLARGSVFARRHLDLWAMPSESALLAGLDVTFSNMDFLRRKAQEKGVPVVFCTFARPDWDHLSAAERAFYDRRILNMIWGPHLTMRAYCRLVDLYNRELRRRCAAWNAPLLDIAPHLAGGIDRYTDICHMRLWAIDDKARIIAEQLAPIISASRGPDPERAFR
ncbi:MAG TPA: hypothetical protein PK379_08080 [Candidatus Hydrogenedentes bacterium]|nr:hypothetical protein [Candidatus Hydrogenedentota bacterium]